MSGSEAGAFAAGEMEGALAQRLETELVVEARLDERRWSWQASLALEVIGGRNVQSFITRPLKTPNQKSQIHKIRCNRSRSTI